MLEIAAKKKKTDNWTGENMRFSSVFEITIRFSSSPEEVRGSFGQVITTAFACFFYNVHVRGKEEGGEMSMSKVRKKLSNTTATKGESVFFLSAISTNSTQNHSRRGTQHRFRIFSPSFCRQYVLYPPHVPAYEIVLGSNIWQNAQHLFFYFVYLHSVIAYW